MSDAPAIVEVDFEAPWFALGDPATNDQHVVSTAALRMMSAGDLPISEGVARALAAYAVRTVEP